MRVIITGACGEIGTRVAHKFLDANHSVIAFDVHPRPSGTAKLRENLTYIEGDVCDYKQVFAAMQGCDAVVHLAAARGPGDYLVAAHNLNVVGSWNALRAAAELGIKRIAQASSINAVGAIYNNEVLVDYLPIDEKHPLRPDEGYGLSKQICEIQGDAICRRFPTLRVATLRPHWCIRDLEPEPIPLLPGHIPKWEGTMFEDVQRKKDETSLKQLWGWNTYTSIADAFYLCITSEGKGWDQGHEAFFIVSPRIGSDKETAVLVDKWFPSTVRRGPLDGNVGLYDCSKAQRLFGWEHDSPHD